MSVRKARPKKLIINLKDRLTEIELIVLAERLIGQYFM